MTHFSRYLILTISFLLLHSASQAEEAKIGDKTKSEWLPLLKDKNPRKREAAVIALGIIGAKDRNVQESFRELMLNDTVERVRLKAVLIVQDFDKENIRVLTPTLADLLKGDKSPIVRAAAAVALGKVGESAKTVIKVIIEAFKDPDIGVRTAAADAVGRIGFEAKEAVPSLAELLKDSDSGVRLAAVFSLGRLGTDGAMATTQLANLLATDKDPNVRKESARSLGLLGLDAKAAVPVLAKAFKEDTATEVRQQSAIALGRMSGELKQVAMILIDVLRVDPDKTIRVLAVQTLAIGLGNDLKNYLKELVEQLSKDPEGEVRLAIVQEVGNLGPDAKEALPALAKATTDVQITIREAAKVAVKKVKGS
ncbi:HEAT repeat domain-containing protein [Zavarzinella formosa]|uniref:HEAT repeat domain-containing protein n=1 Tax=Zavarzinella formosa TaxID=360055 RepID=UPI000496F4AD|nr:HEAT repeat domain-containing protein [Zavarzinella formosa]